MIVITYWQLMHYRLLAIRQEQRMKQTAQFQGWAPDWQEQREASIARMSPEEQAKIREYDAILEERRRRQRGFLQNWRWN